MDHDDPVRIAQELLARLGSGASPEEVALLFRPDAVWEIAGDVGALPWLGRQQGRAAAASFVRNSQPCSSGCASRCRTSSAATARR